MGAVKAMVKDSLFTHMFGDENKDLKANIIFADEERNDIIGEYLASNIPGKDKSRIDEIY